MKKFTIITTFNDNPTYKSFVPYIVEMWKNFGYNIKIGYITDNPSNIVKELKNKTNIEIFKRITEIDSGVQSKVSRIWLASKQENFIIVDVDLFVLNIKYMEDNWFSKYTGDNILAIGGDHLSYQKGDAIGKWPMYYTSGSGKLLHKIINPNNLSYKDLLLSWKNTKQVYDKKEDVGNKFENFSDESLLRKLVFTSDYKNKVLKINRIKDLSIGINDLKYWNLELYKRIDRTWAWTYNKQKLYNGEYIDCFPKRPLNLKDPIIKEIFKYLNIKI